MPHWFSRHAVDRATTMLTEPFVSPYMRANVWHMKGRDADLLVDTGMGLAPLAPRIDTPPGKPLFAVATHIHLDHVGSLHEFALRAGPAASAADFSTMPDRATYADMFRDLADPVTRVPASDWSAAGYTISPAPLARTLAEGDVLDLGDRQFRILELPGHSPDSIALYDERDGLLFSGDAVYDGELIDDLPDSDRGAYRATMRRLVDLPIRIGHGGHGPSFDQAGMRTIARNYLDRPAVS